MYVQTPITVFNRRVGADCREVYLPTCIRSASFMGSIGSGHSSDGSHSQQLAYKLRIPANAEIQAGKTYIQEAAFRLLDDQAAAQHWTLQTGDYVAPIETDLSEPVDAATMEGLAARSHLIAVKEYADNTLRGTAAVQHWRIGGE